MTEGERYKKIRDMLEYGYSCERIALELNIPIWEIKTISRDILIEQSLGIKHYPSNISTYTKRQTVKETKKETISKLKLFIDAKLDKREFDEELKTLINKLKILEDKK